MQEIGITRGTPLAEAVKTKSVLLLNLNLYNHYGVGTDLSSRVVELGTSESVSLSRSWLPVLPVLVHPDIEPSLGRKGSTSSPSSAGKLYGVPLSKSTFCIFF